MLLSAVYAMFYIKSVVQDMSYQITNLTNNIEVERGKINILQAEYAYLISPDRMRKLAMAHTELVPITPVQLAYDPILGKVNNTNDIFKIDVVQKNGEIHGDESYSLTSYKEGYQSKRKWRYKGRITRAVRERTQDQD